MIVHFVIYIQIEMKRDNRQRQITYMYLLSLCSSVSSLRMNECYVWNLKK